MCSYVMFDVSVVSVGGGGSGSLQQMATLRGSVVIPLSAQALLCPSTMQKSVCVCVYLFTCIHSSICFYYDPQDYAARNPAVVSYQGAMPQDMMVGQQNPYNRMSYNQAQMNMYAQNQPLPPGQYFTSNRPSSTIYIRWRPGLL